MLAFAVADRCPEVSVLMTMLSLSFDDIFLELFVFDQVIEVRVRQTNLVITLRLQGQMGDATKMLREVLEKMRRILGEEHPDTITAMNNALNRGLTSPRHAKNSLSFV